MPIFLILLLGSVAMASLGAGARAEVVVFQSSENRVALLELFTSEGCSSCPPAEKWLSSLKQSSALWKGFVPLAFHVDYWDDLGWRDPWASKRFSERQRSYAQAWRSDSIYTPGFVLNGKEWRAWPQSGEWPASTDPKVGILKVTSRDLQHWQVSFAPAERDGRRYEVCGALLESGLISDVKAGENRGRRLNHDFVVTALTTSALDLRGEKLEAGFEFKSTAKAPPKSLALAVWVKALGTFEPIQAVGGWLPLNP